MIPRLVWPGVLLITAGLWMTGCTYTQRLTVNPLDPPPGYEKMPLRATLVLPEALCTYTFRTEQSRSLRTWVYHMGETLCAYAERVVRHSFADVVVTQAEAMTGHGESDVLIRPRLVAILMYFPDFPQSLWEDQEAEVIVEWTLTERCSFTSRPNAQRATPPSHLWRQGAPVGRWQRAAKVAEETHSNPGPSHVGPCVSVMGCWSDVGPRIGTYRSTAHGRQDMNP